MWDVCKGSRPRERRLREGGRATQSGSRKILEQRSAGNLAIKATKSLYDCCVQVAPSRNCVARIVERKRIRLIFVVSHNVLHRLKRIHFSLVSAEDIGARAFGIAVQVTGRFALRWVSGDVVNEWEVRDVVRWEEAIIGQEKCYILAHDVSGNLLQNPQRVWLEGLAWSEELGVRHLPLIVVCSTVVLAENRNPFGAVVGHTIRHDDPEPVEDGGGGYVFVEGRVEYVIRGFRDDQSLVSYEVIIAARDEAGEGRKRNCNRRSRRVAEGERVMFESAKHIHIVAPRYVRLIQFFGFLRILD